MGKKILVVDDEDNIRLLYQEELEEEGYQISTAATAEEALEIIPAFQPDLVIMDIKMPGMSGVEALIKIKEQNRELPVILCSAYGEYKQDFSTWASDAYVVKSANLGELKEHIKHLLTGLPREKS
ncbi:MAG: response regulator [Deltaproteobacteria bacterium]|nr:response regulator [Candidatus Anaeroferrophillus wilburensis]MBN2889062.1 response regulator [Deltaproteobacteria bacterium]